MKKLDKFIPTIFLSFQPICSVKNKSLAVFILNFAIYRLKNSKQYYVYIVVGGIASPASSKVNEADGGKTDEVYFQDLAKMI